MLHFFPTDFLSKNSTGASFWMYYSAVDEQALEVQIYRTCIHTSFHIVIAIITSCQNKFKGEHVSQS